MELVRAPPAIELHPREAGAHDQEQTDQDFGRAAELRRLARHLDRDADAGALARSGRSLRRSGVIHLARRGRAVREAFRRGRRRQVDVGFDDVEFERRPARAEANDVAALEQGVAIDPLAIHEGAVATAQVLEDEPLGLAHDRGMAR